MRDVTCSLSEARGTVANFFQHTHLYSNVHLAGLMPLHILFRRGRGFKLGKMFSTVVGSSGREYTHLKVLQHHPTNPFLNLSLAKLVKLNIISIVDYRKKNWLTHKILFSSDNQLYVLKPISQSIFDHLQEFKEEFGDNPRLRIHVDHNKENKIVVYEYFKTDLLSLVSNYPLLSVEARKSILKELGLGLKDMHSRNWIHLGRALSGFRIILYTKRLPFRCKA